MLIELSRADLRLVLCHLLAQAGDELLSARRLALLAMERVEVYNFAMQHRHLNHQRLTLAAIDDIIARGKRRDWAELRRALLADPIVSAGILRVCQAHIADPYAQRYHFWKQYAERHLA